MESLQRYLWLFILILLFSYSVLIDIDKDTIYTRNIKLNLKVIHVQKTMEDANSNAQTTMVLRRVDVQVEH